MNDDLQQFTEDELRIHGAKMIADADQGIQTAIGQWVSLKLRGLDKMNENELHDPHWTPRRPPSRPARPLLQAK
jgi:hypothetical protein